MPHCQSAIRFVAHLLQRFILNLELNVGIFGVGQHLRSRHAILGHATLDLIFTHLQEFTCKRAKFGIACDAAEDREHLFQSVEDVEYAHWTTFSIVVRSLPSSLTAFCALNGSKSARMSMYNCFNSLRLS